jgi:hypothetical protein
MDQFERAPVRMATMSDVLAVSQGDASARDVGLTLNRIYFLDLKEVRKTLGHTRWLAKRAIVNAVTKSCIQRYARHEDVCVQLSEDTYTLIFSSDEVELIAMRCKQIAQAIEEKLFGQKNLNRVLVRDAATVFSEGAVMRPTDAQVAATIVENARVDQPDEREPAATSAAPAVAEEDRAARRSELLKMLSDNKEEALGYAYQPMWHAKEGRIATYRCQPRRGQGSNADTGYAVLGHSPDHAAIVQLDTHGVEECLFSLKRICDSGAKINLMTSVHFETLASRTSRAQLQEFLAAIPKRFGRMLTLHLSEVPSGIPETRLSEITANITTWVRNVVVSIKLSECPTLQALGARSWQFGRAKIGIIALDFENVVTDDALQRARRVASVLAPRGLQLAALNVPTSAALCELATSDFSFLGGPPIGGFQPRPDLPRPFTMRDLERA